MAIGAFLCMHGPAQPSDPRPYGHLHHERRITSRAGAVPALLPRSGTQSAPTYHEFRIDFALPHTAWLPRYHAGRTRHFLAYEVDLELVVRHQSSAWTFRQTGRQLPRVVDTWLGVTQAISQFLSRFLVLFPGTTL